MAKLPAFQFYTGDWLKDPGLRTCSLAARGLWIDLLCVMSECAPRGSLLVNDRPPNDQTIARMIGCDPAEVAPLLAELKAAGVYSNDIRTGAIFSRRMTRDEKVRKINQRNGKKGGNPILRGLTPPLSAPIRRAEDEDEDEDRKSLEGGPGETAPGLRRFPVELRTPKFAAVFAKYLEHLVSKKKPLGRVQQEFLIEELAEMGHDRAVAAMKHTIARGWQGLREPDGTLHAIRANGNGHSRRSAREEEQLSLIDRICDDVEKGK